MEQALAKVSAGHQKAAWDVVGLDLGTQVKKTQPDGDDVKPLSEQEGYEAALQGPPRPKELSSALVYSIRLSSWQPPHFGLTVQCVAPVLKAVRLFH